MSLDSLPDVRPATYGVDKRSVRKVLGANLFCHPPIATHAAFAGIDDLAKSIGFAYHDFARDADVTKGLSEEFTHAQNHVCSICTDT